LPEAKMALLASSASNKLKGLGKFRGAGNSVKSLFLSENQQEKALFYQQAST
jgi:hypothetical protein